MASTLSRRQRRAAGRRRDILAAAISVFRQKGYDRATTREIAAAADVSEGTIYNYFRSKNELLMGIVREIVPSLLGEALYLDEVGDVRARFTGALERMLNFVDENRDILNVLAGEAWRNEEILYGWLSTVGQELLARLEQRLAGLITSGALRPLDVGLAARMILFTAVGVALPIVRGVWDLPNPTQRHQLAENLADLLLNGMIAR
jgi:AcrR family transcriptional regulator